ncbi:hypothetical protein H2248_006947 [Termitomyces sp. 'cryptogamus']|nr:hypothetical protein H2248_006947 [Termitomyces sp. 'cryptogamus']
MTLFQVLGFPSHDPVLTMRYSILLPNCDITGQAQTDVHLRHDLLRRSKGTLDNPGLVVLFIRTASYGSSHTTYIYHRLDGTLVENGARVWSSIPPYIWLVINGHLNFMRSDYCKLPKHLTPQKFKLLFVEDMVALISHSFI